MGARAKSKYTEPCNRCGYCCKSALCIPAVIAHGPVEGPCPELKYEGNRAVCNLMEQEKELLGSNLVATVLGVGEGCTCPDPRY